MKKIYSVSILVFASLINSTSVFASNYPSYSYVEVSAVSWDILGLKKINGPRAQVSLELGDTLFVLAEGFQISKQQVDGSDSIKDEFDSKTIGMGIRSSTVNKTSWYLAATYGKWTWDTTETFSGTTDVYTEKPDLTTLIIGFRSQITKQFELCGSIQGYELDENNGDEFYPSDKTSGNAIQLGLSYQFIEDLHLVLDYSKSESDVEYTRTSLGLRYSF
jgi:predicted porin